LLHAIIEVTRASLIYLYATFISDHTVRMAAPFCSPAAITKCIAIHEISHGTAHRFKYEAFP